MQPGAQGLVRAVRAFVAHYMHWNWGSTATTHSTGRHTAASRTRREDFVVQVELSTIVSGDCADVGESRGNLAPDSKVQDAKLTGDTIGFESTGDLNKDGQGPPSAMDKAERGALTDLNTRVDTDEPSLNPPRAIAFQLTSPRTPSTQSMLHRREEMCRKQAEENEFMRII